MATEKIEAKTVNIITTQRRRKRRPVTTKQKVAVVNTKRRYSHTGKVGEIISVEGKSFVKNIKANANKELLKTLAWGMLGAAMEPLVPTLVQAVTQKDMSGWKGLALGVGTAAITGLATGKAAITVGATCSAATHLLYSELTGAIENITGVSIFRMHPDTVVTSDQLTEAIQQGIEQNTGANALSDGGGMQKCTSCR